MTWSPDLILKAIPGCLEQVGGLSVHVENIVRLLLCSIFEFGVVKVGIMWKKRLARCGEIVWSRSDVFRCGLWWVQRVLRRGRG